MKEYLIIFSLIGVLISCHNSGNKENKPEVQSDYENKYVSIAVMEKLDDFIAGYNSLSSEEDDIVYYDLLVFRDDSECYISFVESSGTYNSQELAGFFQFDGATVCVYIDDLRCGEKYIRVERLNEGSIAGLLDISDKEDDLIRETCTVSFITYKLDDSGNLVYVPI